MSVTKLPPRKKRFRATFRSITILTMEVLADNEEQADDMIEEQSLEYENMTEVSTTWNKTSMEEIAP